MPKAKIGDAIYTGMVTRCSDAKTMFGDVTSLDRHLRHFAGLLQCAVDNLNDMEVALQPWLEMIGKGHAGFSIRQGSADFNQNIQTYFKPQSLLLASFSGRNDSTSL